MNNHSTHFSRYVAESQVMAASPVLTVQVVIFLDGYGIEIAIPSIVKPSYSSYVVISRETKRFVNEIHDHKEELRSSNELLTAERRFDGCKETCALNSIKETCASPRSNPIGDSFFKKTVTPRGERKWITIDADLSPRNGLRTKVSKMVTKMVRHYDEDEREEDGSRNWETAKSLLLKELSQERAK